MFNFLILMKLDDKILYTYEVLEPSNALLLHIFESGLYFMEAKFCFLSWHVVEMVPQGMYVCMMGAAE